METIEVLKKYIKEEKTLKLSDMLNKEIIEQIKIDNYERDYYFLKDTLKETLKLELEEKKIFLEDVILDYDLSYCQNSHFDFIGKGYFLYNKRRYYVSINNVDYYNNTYIIAFNDESLNNEAKKDVQNYIRELYKSICKEMMNIGYNYIEEDELYNFKQLLAFELNTILNLENNDIEADDLLEVINDDEKDKYIEIDIKDYSTLLYLRDREVKNMVIEYIVKERKEINKF